MTYKKIITINLAIALFLLPKICYTQTLLFSDNFEDGNLDGWAHTPNVVISTDRAYSGSYSAKCTHNSSVVLRTQLNHATMLGYNEVTVRWKWFTANTWVTGTGVKFFRMEGPQYSGYQIYTGIWWSEALGDEPRNVGGQITGSAVQQYKAFNGSKQPFNRGQWMQVEVHYILNTPGSSNGTLEVSFDGVKRYSNYSVGFRNTASLAYAAFTVASNIGTSNANCINYIDNVEIWAGMPTGTSTTTTTITPTTTTTSPTTTTISSPDQAWNATDQTGDPTWTDSGVTWCVRAPLEGDSITQSLNWARLGFQGRNSGNYTLRKVSIGERNAEGDVVDATWTKVTFDQNSEDTWANDSTTIPQGATKLSNPIEFSMQPGKDYYVTFLLESPAAYLTAPSEYEELYFSSGDYTEVRDWSNIGYSTYNGRLHGVSLICIPPDPPSGLQIVQQ